MYPEFIAIYVGLGLLVAMLAVVIVLLIVLNRKVSSGDSAQINHTPMQGQGDNVHQAGAPFNVAFCNHCGTAYDAKTGVCPKCGTPRR